MLSDVVIRNLKPSARGQLEVWDAKLPGFGIRVSSRGTKSFVLLYRADGRARRLTLGRYPILGLAEARREAMAALAAVGRGGDPAGERVRTKETLSADGFETIVADFIERYAKRKNRRWEETGAILKREFVSVWGLRKIDEITKRDVVVVVDGIVERGKNRAANRAFAHVRKFFNWSVEQGMLEHSPCQGLRAPAKTASRDPFR